jgi:uncharacterized membrane protein (Fun14 family)
MSELISPIAYQVGAGGILGFIVGYAIKKLLKLLAVVVGLFSISLIYLGYTGVISVDYDKLILAIEGIFGNLGGTASWISPIIASLPFAGTFILGIVIGLKKG